MFLQLCFILVLNVCSANVSCRPIDSFYRSNAGLPSFEEMYSYYEDWTSAYHSSEIKHSNERFEVFSNRALKIILHNQNENRTYDQGINRFTGLLSYEVVKKTIMTPQNCTIDANPILNSTGKAGTSDFHDWRDKRKVSEIKTQRDCGASWAFAAVCATESHWAIRTDVTPIFASEQQLIDCGYDFQAQGCDGGLPQQGFSHIQYNKGLNSENAYPFESLPSKCRTNELNIVARVFNGSLNISAGDEETIFNVTKNIGPVAIGLDVTDDLLAYEGGVYKSTVCKNDTKIINHALTIVGYGYDIIKDLDYWIIKNSWGPGWGEEGYVRIARGINVCGLANCASYPNMNYTSVSINSISSY